MDAKRLSQVCLMGLAVMLAGCSTTGFLKFGKNKYPKAGPSNPVVQILTLWQPAEGVGIENRSCRGFAGEILFFSQQSASPAQVDGTVRIYVFDNQGTLEEQSKPIHQFDFPSEAWKTHQHLGQLGPTYSIFIPYTRKGSYEAQCSLRVRFTPKTGPVTFSDIVTVHLEGKTNPDGTTGATPPATAAPAASAATTAPATSPAAGIPAAPAAAAPAAAPVAGIPEATAAAMVAAMNNDQAETRPGRLGRSRSVVSDINPEAVAAQERREQFHPLSNAERQRIIQEAQSRALASDDRQTVRTASHVQDSRDNRDRERYADEYAAPYKDQYEERYEDRSEEGSRGRGSEQARRHQSRNDESYAGRNDDRYENRDSRRSEDRAPADEFSERSSRSRHPLVQAEPVPETENYADRQSRPVHHRHVLEALEEEPRPIRSEETPRGRRTHILADLEEVEEQVAPQTSQRQDRQDRYRVNSDGESSRRSHPLEDSGAQNASTISRNHLDTFTVSLAESDRSE